MIAAAFGYTKELVHPTSIEEVPNLTLRPKDMSLSNHKLCAFLDSSIPSLEQQIHTLKLEGEAKKERHVIPYGRQDVSLEETEDRVEHTVIIIHLGLMAIGFMSFMGIKL